MKKNSGNPDSKAGIPDICALLRGENLSQKLYPWRKNDIYTKTDEFSEN